MARRTPEADKEYKRTRRALAVEKMGGACVRCGITNPVAFDHINNDGHRDRSETSHKVAMLILGGWDRSRFQLLCPNCNYLKAFDPDEYAKPPTYGPILGGPRY
jgi:hypothetical protein